MPSNFDLKGMCQAVQAGRLEWQRHVLERMAQRDISQQDVLKILLNGQIIEDYPSDWPFPSALILGWRGKNPLHAVVSFNKTFPGKIAVIPETRRPHEIIPQRVRAEIRVAREDIQRRHDIAERFAHLLALQIHEAVPEYAFG